MKNFFSKEVRIAIVAVAGIVVLFLGLNFLKGMSVFNTDDVYYIKFKDVNGLSASTPIYADGYKVGVVKDIAYDYANQGNVVVRFHVDDDLRIPKGSTAEIASDIMGNTRMNLLLANNPRERMEPGDTLQGDLSHGMMDAVARMMPTIEATFHKVDTLLNHLNAIMANPAIAHTLNNVEVVTANLNTSTQQLNTLMAEMNRQLPRMAGKANKVLDNTEQLTAQLAAVDVAGTMAKVDATLNNVQSFTEKLNSNKGTLGLLMNDDRLYHNLNSTATHADSLVIDLKSHPKRYVHFSIFGRKDK